MRFVAFEGVFPLGDKRAREMKRYSLAKVLIAAWALLFISLNGKAVPVETSSIFVQGGSHEKRNWAMIGGGTAGGALIGGLAGGGKGALIGSAIGAAGGTTAAYASGKKEVGISVERRLVFRLTQPLVTQG